MGKFFDHSMLKNFKFFKNLNDHQLNLIMQSTNLKIFRKERAIFYQDDKSEAAFFVLSGEVKKIKYRNDMTSILIGRITDGYWIGLPEVIAGALYLYDALTSEETTVLVFSKFSLKNLMKIPEFQGEIVHELSLGYYSIYAQLDAHTSLQKLTRFLSIKLKNLDNDKYEIIITQENIADSIGVTRETVNKHLQFLQQKGFIRLSRSRIEFSDKEKFIEFSSECM